MEILLFFAYIGIMSLHLASLITTLLVIHSVIWKSEFLNPITRLCLFAMYFSSIFTDIGYSYAVYYKYRKEELLFHRYELIEGGDLNKVVFFHDVGFAAFAVGIFITASERLLTSNYCCNWLYRSKWLIYPFCCLLFTAISIFSIAWSLFLTGTQQLAASIICYSLFILSSFQLFLAVVYNVKNYKKGVGQSLDKRFKCASTYYFNRHLFLSLLGEIILRVAAFTSLFFGLKIGVPIEWASFSYHNLISIGNVIFPWLIIIRRGKRTMFRARKGVTDLTGKQLKLRVNLAEHYDAVYKLWN